MHTHHNRGADALRDQTPPPRIGITLGDPAGIGPELIVRLLYEGVARAGPGIPWRLYGDRAVLEQAAAGLSLPLVLDRVELVEVTRLPQVRPGAPDRASAAAQVAYLEAAVADAEAGLLAGLCTAPIHKAGAHAAGFGFPGHTEFLQTRLGRPGEQVVMMLAGPSLRVALCTTHLPLSAVPAALTVEVVTAVLRTTVLALVRDFGIPAPLVWVAALNPHAGEGGLFGHEEQQVIAPAIERARGLPELQAITGLDLRGPAVPDAVFRAAVYPPPPGRRPDAVVVMYHDQGLIPLKLIDFDEGVNVTLGLRLPRTSPDHGVAHDIAGRGLARATSMRAALHLCAAMVILGQGVGPG